MNKIYKIGAGIVGTAILLSPVLAVSAYATTATSTSAPATSTPASSSFKVFNFNAVNIGPQTKTLPTVAHLNISNSDTIGTQDIVFVPYSQLNSLTQSQKAELKAKIDSNHFVILYRDGTPQISMGDLENALGFSNPLMKMSSKKVALNSALSIKSPYAVGLVKLANGQIDHLTFSGNSINSLSKVGIESIWGGLSGIRSHAVKGPNGNGADPSYLANHVFTFSSSGGYDGEISATDNLTMNRVNNDTLSVWTDSMDYEVMPGSVLYNDGETQFQSTVDSWDVLVDDQDASPEQVTANSPNGTTSQGSLTVSVTTDSITASYNWAENYVTVTNKSDLSQAQWDVHIGSSSSSMGSTYNFDGAWQMTNPSGYFVYDVSLTPQWYNTLDGYTWSDPTYVNQVTEPDW